MRLAGQTGFSQWMIAAINKYIYIYRSNIKPLHICGSKLTLEMDNLEYRTNIY